MTATALRTPGVTFTVVPPATPQTLPRMDIAGFVGFAASGPIDTPVPVEDPNDYQALFGQDLLLARDEVTAADVYCNLGPAVRAFFTNGGRRCWVVRVARDARTSLVSVPGLVTRTLDGALVPATLAARSAGSWADELEVSAALGSVAIQVSWASLAGDAPELIVDEASDIVPGDLVRLTIGPRRAMMVVGDTEPGPSPAGVALRVRAIEDPVPALAIDVTVGTAAVGRGSILWARDAVAGADPLPAPGEEGVARVPSVSPAGAPATFKAAGDSGVTLAIADVLAPTPGQYLVVEGLPGAAGEDLWVLVDDVHVDPTQDATLIVQGAAELVIAASGAAGFDGPPDFAERLTLDLFARPPGGDVAQLAGLGFARAHAGWVGRLPSDEQLFDPVVPEADSPAPDPMWGAVDLLPLWTPDHTPDLWTRVTTPRFAVAAAVGDGLPLIGPVSYPLAMPVVETHWAAPAADPDTTLVRDGLAVLSSGLFVDDRLRGELTTDLLGQADAVALTGAAPEPLRGLHSLLYNDEVTLIGAPDACQRGWTFAKPPPASALPGPARFAIRRGAGTFIDCGTQELSAPQLNAPLLGLYPARAGSPPVFPDAQVFTLSWSPADVDAPTFVLQQSFDPVFTAPTTYYEGPRTSITVYALDAGQQPGAGPYFRVRVFAGASESDWSATVQVVAGPTLRAVAIPVEAYSPAALIDVHRALLRMAAARGDVFAVLALPGHYTERETLAHQGQLLTAQVPPPDGLDVVSPLPQGEASAYSFGALYHPWPVIVEPDGATTAVPPDGAAIGIVSALAVPPGAAASSPPARPGASPSQPTPVGAWISPGNVPLSGVVALTPALDPTLLPPGAVARVNVLSQAAHGFVSLSAWTLSTDQDLVDINVRRLLSELRRMAMLLGPRYVFEPNGPRLVHAITREFEALLTQLFTGGAFAGSTAATSYFLNVASGADPATGLDPGQLRIQIGVAPSRPLRFLTVLLTQEVGGVTQVGGT